METASTVAYPAFHSPPQLRIADGRMVSASGYDIVTISPQDSDRALEFLKKFFFHDEPLNICVGLLDGPGSRCLELEDYCKTSMSEGVSCMAVSDQDEIIGVCISGLLVKEEAPSEPKKEVECAHPRFIKIMNLLNTVGEESDVFGQFPDIDRVVDIRVISVDDAYRGRGIAKALIERTKQIAKEEGIKMVRVDCTSHFSALAVARLGFHCIYTLNYSDHLNRDGTPVFEPESPHTCVKTFVTPVL